MATAALSVEKKRLNISLKIYKLLEKAADLYMDGKMQEFRTVMDDVTSLQTQRRDL